MLPSVRRCSCRGIGEGWVLDPRFSHRRAEKLSNVNLRVGTDLGSRSLLAPHPHRQYGGASRINRPRF